MLDTIITLFVSPIISGVIIACFEHWLNNRKK